MTAAALPLLPLLPLSKRIDSRPGPVMIVRTTDIDDLSLTTAVSAQILNAMTCDLALAYALTALVPRRLTGVSQVSNYRATINPHLHKGHPMNRTSQWIAATAHMFSTVPPATAALIFGDELEGLACDADLERVQPPGFTGHVLQWHKVFYGATLPAGPSHLSPVGSFTLKHMDPYNKGPALQARYFSIPFIPAGNKSYTVKWLGAQSIHMLKYSARQADSLFVSVSRCQGDLRSHSYFSTDMEIYNCRAQLYEGKLVFGTRGNSQCRLIADEQYYLNIAFVDTAGTAPLSTTETTCSTGNRCEANFELQ